MNPTSPVRCVAFDVVGTLLYPEPAVARVYAQIGARHGSGRTETEVAARFQQAMGIFSRDFSEHGGRTSEEHERSLWREVVAGVLDDVPCIDECYADLFAWFSRSEAWRVFEDVAPAVHALQAGGVAIALASNFDSRLHAVCEGFPVLRDLRVRAVSSELGYRKPHILRVAGAVVRCASSRHPDGGRYAGGGCDWSTRCRAAGGPDRSGLRSGSAGTDFVAGSGE